MLNINNCMPVEINYVDTFQTRVSQSYVNLTQMDSASYPAVTTTRIEPAYLQSCYPGSTAMDLLTSYSIYDQWAQRVFVATV